MCIRDRDTICKPECIFASNTSSLSITEIGKNVKRPVVGMHFFNPADRMKMCIRDSYKDWKPSQPIEK